MHALPVSLISVKSFLAGVIDTSQPKMIPNFPGAAYTGNASFTSINNTSNACTVDVAGTGQENL